MQAAEIPEQPPEIPFQPAPAPQPQTPKQPAAEPNPDREYLRQKPNSNPKPPGHDGLALMIMAVIAFVVAMLNLAASASTETVMQQIVLSVRFYGAMACFCILVCGSCICSIIAKSSRWMASLD